MPTTKTFELKNISEIAKYLTNKVKNGGVIAMSGNLGSGKTTLAKEIGNCLQIDECEIKSPTYNLIRRYPEKNFYHADLYRIKEGDEIALLEIFELIENQKNIILIEWPEIISDYLPENSLKIQLKIIDDKTRELIIT